MLFKKRQSHIHVPSLLCCVVRSRGIVHVLASSFSPHLRPEGGREERGRRRKKEERKEEKGKREEGKRRGERVGKVRESGGKGEYW